MVSYSQRHLSNHFTDGKGCHQSHTRQLGLTIFLHHYFLCLVPSPRFLSDGSIGTNVLLVACLHDIPLHAVFEFLIPLCFDYIDFKRPLCFDYIDFKHCLFKTRSIVKCPLCNVEYLHSCDHFLSNIKVNHPSHPLRLHATAHLSTCMI